MAVKSSNKLLPVLVGLVFLVAFIVFSKTNTDSDTTQLSEYPVAENPEADSPADTIRTLTATVAQLKTDNQQLSGQAKELLNQQEAVENNVLMRLRGQIEADKQVAASATNEPYQRLLNKYNELETKIGTIGTGDVPVGLGLDEYSGGEDQWVEPASYSGKNKSSFTLPTATTEGAGGFLKQSNTNPALLKRPVSIPKYTVPRNATLIGSVSMTALIGRVPSKGSIEDPYPFKVIVGKDNLAANGLEVPGVRNMIFSGKAIGDWTLSCVRGEMESVTFVFEDGTIKTLSSDDQSLKAAQSGGDTKAKALAWISDERGIPCVTGKRISNATSFLLARVAAKGFEAGAKAVADAETTTVVSNVTGVAATNITGNALKNAGYETLSGGASELGDWLKERQSQTYDVIYVNSGAKIALHIDIELPIDYETNGRKLNYANQIKTAHTTTLD